MNRNNIFSYTLTVVLALLLAAPLGVFAESNGEGPYVQPARAGPDACADCPLP